MTVIIAIVTSLSYHLISVKLISFIVCPSLMEHEQLRWHGRNAKSVPMELDFAKTAILYCPGMHNQVSRFTKPSP